MLHNLVLVDVRIFSSILGDDRTGTKQRESQYIYGDALS